MTNVGIVRAITTALKKLTSLIKGLLFFIKFLLLKFTLLIYAVENIFCLYS